MFFSPNPMSLLLIICFLALLISPSTAIIGGEQSPITDEPWTVAIYLQNNYTCGGSILSSGYVLTAAQCVDKVTLSDISILYGTAELLVGGKFTFAKHIYFLRYDPSTYANNIAIIKTTAPMKLDYMTCKPIDLPQLEFDPKKGTEVLVSGWGDPDPTQEIWAGSLNAANFTVVDRSECQERYKAMHNESYVTFEVFCTGGGNVSIESHDAGDPAVQNSMLVGVASYPKGYEPEFPSIFTRVGAFVTWIREIIEKA